MTQEQIIRRMLQGFVDDPPDSEYQDGFLNAILSIAREVMGFDWNDPIFAKVDEVRGPHPIAEAATAEKMRPALQIIKGGKTDND